MWALLSLLAPFFGLVWIGWWAARRGILPLEGIGALMVFVLYFALSALLFRLGAGGVLQAGASVGLLAVYAGASLVVIALGLIWGLRRGLSRRDSGMAAMVAVFPNTGFLGLPLLTGLLGTEAAGAVAATLLVDVLMTLSLCMAWVHSRAGPRGPGGEAAVWHEALRTSVQGALRNPLLWAMAAGMGVAALGWTVPKPLDDTLRLLGQAATPAALFTLGAIVAREQLKQKSATQVVAQAVQASSLSWLAGFKLLAHPALVCALGWGAIQVGVPLPTLGLTAIVLAAALPSAANVSMLAEREGANTAMVARVILWTTAAAIVSLLAWASVLGVQTR